LGSETAEIVTWHTDAVHGGTETPDGVFRVTGTARAQGTILPWSLVLKIVRPAEEYAAPTHPYYWKREVLAYRSGVLAALPSSMAAPRCFGSVDTPVGGAWLWLEDVTDACGPQWPLACYARAARCLGHFNGAYLAGRPLPTASWLSRAWLYTGVEAAASAIAQFPAVLAHPRVRQWYPDAVVTRLLRLWADRATLLAALTGRPQTFCHLDAFRRNLFLRQDAAGHDQLVAVDWGFAGVGALGQELAAFIFGSLVFAEVDLAAAEDLEELALAAYLEGLQAAGWRGDPRAVRLGYCSAAPLLYLLHGLEWILSTLQDERRYAGLAQASIQESEEAARQFTRVADLLFARADEARRLAQAI
jgi:hypothetical protein